MSQQVQVDYEQIAIQCNSVCEVAEARLKELDELLRQSEEASSKLMTPEAKSLAESIKAERQALEENIKAVRKKGVRRVEMGIGI
jgi:low affinity Fe/Cu permease